MYLLYMQLYAWRQPRFRFFDGAWFYLPALAPGRSTRAPGPAFPAVLALDLCSHRPLGREQVDGLDAQRCCDPLQ